LGGWGVLANANDSHLRLLVITKGLGWRMRMILINTCECLSLSFATLSYVG